MNSRERSLRRELAKVGVGVVAATALTAIPDPIACARGAV